MAQTAVIGAVLATVVAAVTVLGSGSHRELQLYPIAVYAHGRYSDAVSDLNDPRHRESPLDWTHHFVLLSRGLRVGSADVVSTVVTPKHGTPCSQPVLGVAETSDPLLEHGIELLPGLAVSIYTAVSAQHSVPAPLDPRYSRDVLAAAATALAKAGKHPKQGPGFDELHVQNIDVMWVA